jgi:hypothetical protein
MQEYASTQGTTMPSCVLSKARKCLHNTPDQSRYKNVIKDSVCYQSGWHVFKRRISCTKKDLFRRNACESRFPRGEDSRAKLLKQGPLSHHRPARTDTDRQNPE